MKKLIISLFVVGFIFALGYVGASAVRSFKVQDVAMDQNGNAVHPSLLGKTYAQFSSTTEAVVCTGKCLIHEIILSSGADGAYAIVKDSATADGSGDDIFAQLEFDGTGHLVMSGGSNAFPIQTTLGITLDLSSVGSNEEILIVYTDLD